MVKIDENKSHSLSLWNVIIFGTFIYMATSTYALAWTTPVNISNTSKHSRHPSVAIGEDDNIHVVWTEEDTENDEILYCYYNGYSWSAPFNISNDLTNSRRPDISIDSDGNLHVVWMDSQTGEIIWTFYNGISWSSPLNIPKNPVNSVSPRLAANGLNEVFAVWHSLGTQSDIYFSSYNGSNWSTPQNVTNDPQSSAYPDIAVDSYGNIHLIWMDYGSLDIHYSEYDGNTWTDPVNISQLHGQSCKPKIIVDLQDHIHAIWEERSEGYHIYYSMKDASMWSSPEKLSAARENYRPNIVVDSYNAVYTIWARDTGPGLQLEWKFYDTSWSDIFVVPTPPGRATEAQLAADAKNTIRLIYTDDAEDNRDIFCTWQSSTGIEVQPERTSPRRYILEQNYPNPFNSETVIPYSLFGNNPISITLKIYNLLGEEVVTILNAEQEPGNHTVIWDGREKNGLLVSSGIYFYRLQARGIDTMNKMLILR